MNNPERAPERPPGAIRVRNGGFFALRYVRLARRSLGFLNAGRSDCWRRDDERTADVFRRQNDDDE